MKVTSSVKEYIEKNAERNNVHWRIADGKWQFKCKCGEWKSERLFSKYYPRYQYYRYTLKGENPNTRSLS